MSNILLSKKCHNKNEVQLICERKIQIKNTHTYIIGRYNASVRIIDVASHTIHVVYVNFIHNWRDLQFKVDSERKIF